MRGRTMSIYALSCLGLFFFFNDTATTEIYTLSLHDALPICITICMELLNSKVNHKDYQCDHTQWGVDVCKAVGSPRVKLLYDIYHMQIMEGDIIRTIRDNIQYIGHFHTGGVPGRNELDETQELNWRTIAQAIADLKFEGYFAHEFVPLKDPMTSLKQAITLCTV